MNPDVMHQPMAFNIAVNLQLAWSVVIALIVIPAAIDSPSTIRLYSAAFSLLLLGGAKGCKSGAWQCWVLTTTATFFTLYQWLPRIAYNLYLMSWIDHPLFHESPGTGLVVLVYFFIFIIPPFAIWAFLAIHWCFPNLLHPIGPPGRPPWLRKVYRQKKAHNKTVNRSTHSRGN